jgi:hypothetical protein
MAGRTVHLLDLSTAPVDPVERVFWLDGVMAKVRDELDDAYTEAYFEARLQGRFDAALRVGRTSKTKALRLTRRKNNESGRSIRWSDGADPTSSAYSG